MDRARRFGAFLCKPPSPQERGAAELEAFLKYLAVNLHVLATIKNQAKVEISNWLHLQVNVRCMGLQGVLWVNWINYFYAQVSC